MPTKTELKRLKQWRENYGLSHEKLGELTGYSRVAVYWFERGETPPRRYANKRKTNREIDPFVWYRFKMACAGVDAALRHGDQFDW